MLLHRPDGCTLPCRRSESSTSQPVAPSRRRDRAAWSDRWTCTPRRAVLCRVI